MKLKFTFILFFFISLLSYAQKEFHVFPNGKNTGNGSLEQPWDLQTALSQKPDVVNGGDIIWLHKGVYNGRFISTLKSTISGKKIKISSIKNEKVVLNGNVSSKRSSVLEVKGNDVIYRDFDITCIGNLSRQIGDANFKSISGLNHTFGEDCEFIGLKIYNNTGFGFGSWKHAAASVIEECLIFNNGSIAKNGKGRGEGIYTQNKSDKTRIIKNNIIFNNYYKAIEVWSANKHADFEYVKNFNIENNVIFNSGLPAGFAYDNLIIGTDDREGINIAKDINISNNIFYHNTNILKGQINGNAPSLTLGFYKNAPIENITVKDNIIIGRNNGLRILYAKSLTFKNNLVYSGYVRIDSSFNKKQLEWNFSNNTYFTKRNKAFRFHKSVVYNLNYWKKNITLDDKSTWKHIKAFEMRNVLDITKSAYKPNTFRVVLFNKNGDNVEVDFSKYRDITQNLTYKIKNIETDAVISSGILNADKRIDFSIGTYNKTSNNFGVFFIEFELPKIEEQRKTVFGKFFRWLGF